MSTIEREAETEAEHQAEVDREDARLRRQMMRVYESIDPEEMGDGFFLPGLHDFHHGIDFGVECSFYTTPRPLPSDIDDDIATVTETPAAHPLRAIAKLVDIAPSGSTVRAFCYRLTDFIAIELLVHAGHDREVQVILSPSEESRNALNDFITTTGLIGRNALLENVEIRLANLSGSACNSRYVSMHDMSIITDHHSSCGSYNTSFFARFGNWESLQVVPTTQTHRDRFDDMWNELYSRPAERYYGYASGARVGPRRQRRQEHRELMQRQAVARQASRQSQGSD